MEVLLLLGYLLATISALALVFKAISTAAWNHGSVTLLVGLTQTKSILLLPRNEVPILSGNRLSTELSWATIGASFGVAAFSIWAARRAAKNGPFAGTIIQRLLFHSVYYAALALCVTTLGFLTYTHRGSNSPRTTQITPQRDDVARCYGFCDGTFDRETWACAVAGYTGVVAGRETAGMVCVGEAATRGLTFVLAIIMFAMGVWLQWDRWTKRAILTSWKVRARVECELDDLRP